MAKKDYSSVICQECLHSAEDKGFDRFMFYVVDTGRCMGVFCEKCIDKEKLIAKYPYYNKPKKEKQINSFLIFYI